MDVHDPNYRKALCLPSASLALSASLQLPSRVLEEIQLLLQPQAAVVTAALDKLNIYGPNGFFKSHLDTPRAPNMFGSLVVCLPTEFAGGELVLRGPGGVQYTQDWGSSSAESPALQWAAFYSDVEHEILPVTSGYRYSASEVGLPGWRQTVFAREDFELLSLCSYLTGIFTCDIAILVLS
jgi:predicted 2-oxoglutarate/Fe(II)-dependent dioxygenase YbiX